MVALFKELQPVDAYTVNMSQPFSAYDQKFLTLFYQPLIGSVAMSLYMTLLADAERGDEQFNHYYLMNVLSLPLKPIFEARISLEAIGLIRTYVKDHGNDRAFIYELSPPLDAKAFFEDPLLSTFLFSKIGEQAYRNLRDRFIVSDEQKEQYKEVTRTFLDVYTPVHHGMEHLEGDYQYVGRDNMNDLPFKQYDFDFDLFRSGLSEQMVPQSALASISKTFIAKLAFMYALTPIDMQKVAMIALDEQLDIQPARLRKAAAEYYKMNTSKTPPILGKAFEQQAPVKEGTTAEPLSREEALVQYLDHTSPIEILRDLLDGKEPLPVDVELAERLVTTHELPIGVVNVLLQYVYIRNDGKITKNYVERIASHWMNKKISNAQEALKISREEHDKYVRWKEEEKKGTKNYRQPKQKEGVVPEWFYKKEQKEVKNDNEQNKTTTSSREETKEEQASLEERRRKLRESLMKKNKEVK